MNRFFFHSMSQSNKRIVFAAGPVTERGGPVKYTRKLAEGLRANGYVVRAVHFDLFNSFIPGLRHVAYSARLLAHSFRSDAIIAFDTWSVGIPALIVSKITRSKLIIRVGGDFLWEHYVERTGTPVRLSEFYTSSSVQLSTKEKIIFTGTRYLLRNADSIAFNTEWQKDIWQRAYRVSTKARIIENVYPTFTPFIGERSKVFVSAGRNARLKNTQRVEELFAEVQKSYPEYSLDTRVLSEAEHATRLASCYAVIQGSISDIAPNSIIEASASGTPFICTRDTGIQDRLQGRGLFIDTHDEHAFREALVSYIHGEKYRTIYEQAQLPGFTRTWEMVCSDYMQTLEDVRV